MKKEIKLSEGILQIEGSGKLFELVEFGERINPRRPFLFVSKVLGKHFPAEIGDIDKTYFQLLNLIDKISIEKNLLVIAMAETATALGWGVFDSINYPEKVFFHSSRLVLNKNSLFQFDEPHSHAAEHYLYQPIDEEVHNKILNIGTIILIDDEITSGRTLTNLANKLLVKFPKAKISFLTLVHWNNSKLDFPVLSLERGSFEYIAHSNTPIQTRPTVQSGNRYVAEGVNTVINQFGRFGSLKFPELNFDNYFFSYRNKKILVLGTGEFIYAAIVLARILGQKNKVWVQSTSRSPVKVGLSIQSKMYLKDNYNNRFDNYLYNVSDKYYDLIIILAESPANSVDSNWINDLKNYAGELKVLYL